MKDRNQEFIKTITIPVNNRPHYFKKALLSIVKNDLNDWKIFFSIEPSEYSGILVNLIKEIIADRTNYQIKNNVKKKGLKKILIRLYRLHLMQEVN
jgi:hypothetical protein